MRQNEFMIYVTYEFDLSRTISSEEDNEYFYF